MGNKAWREKKATNEIYAIKIKETKLLIRNKMRSTNIKVKVKWNEKLINWKKELMVTKKAQKVEKKKVLN